MMNLMDSFVKIRDVKKTVRIVKKYFLDNHEHYKVEQKLLN